MSLQARDSLATLSWLGSLPPAPTRKVSLTQRSASHYHEIRLQPRSTAQEARILSLVDTYMITNSLSRVDFTPTSSIYKKVLSDEEKNEVFGEAEQAVPEGKVLAIKYRMIKGFNPDPAGRNWPLNTSSDEAKHFKANLVNDFFEAKEWTIYVPNLQKFHIKLELLGNTFGKIGRGPNWSRYKAKGGRLL